MSRNLVHFTFAVSGSYGIHDLVPPAQCRDPLWQGVRFCNLSLICKPEANRVRRGDVVLSRLRDKRRLGGCFLAVPALE